MYLTILSAFITIFFLLNKLPFTWPSLGKTMPSANRRKPGLPDQIYTSFRTSKFGDQDLKFLPEGRINSLIAVDNLESIKRIIGHKEFAQIGSLESHILDDSKKIFAIAIDTGFKKQSLVKAMRMLEEHNLTDGKLPLSQDELQSLRDAELEAMPVEEDLSSSMDIDDELIWTDAHIGNFLDNQWKFLAPVFSLNGVNQDVRQRDILPFTEKTHRSSGTGAYGRVFKCKIHHSHMTGGQRPIAVRL